MGFFRAFESIEKMVARNPHNNNFFYISFNCPIKFLINQKRHYFRKSGFNMIETKQSGLEFLMKTMELSDGEADNVASFIKKTWNMYNGKPFF